MATKKTAVATKEPSGHEPEIEEYKSTFMNTTLYQPFCSCGWEDARWFTEHQAKAAWARHLTETV